MEKVVKQSRASQLLRFVSKNRKYLPVTMISGVVEFFIRKLAVWDSCFSKYDLLFQTFARHSSDRKGGSTNTKSKEFFSSEGKSVGFL